MNSNAPSGKSSIFSSHKLRSLAAGLILGGAAVGAVGAVGMQALAAGVPDVNALTYTGYLETPAGVPVTTLVNLNVSVYDAEVAGNKVCEKAVMDLAPVAGRFQVELPDNCVAAVKANPNLWVEILVGGAALGRTKLGAVPYALEAGHATSADSATNATNATTATGALHTRITALEACPGDPQAPAAYGFCIWHENNGTYYSQTYREAAATCKAKGARLCTLAEVSAAQAAGAQWCAFSWVADRADNANGYQAFPMQTLVGGCGGLIGVVSDTRSFSDKIDANCCKP